MDNKKFIKHIFQNSHNHASPPFTVLDPQITTNPKIKHIPQNLNNHASPTSFITFPNLKHTHINTLNDIFIQNIVSTHFNNYA